MDEARRLGPLEAWGLATFHVSLLVGALVLAFHRAGTLGLLLQGLGTLPGSGIFLLLWGLATWTTRKALGRLGAQPLADGAKGVVDAAAIWGGVTGAAFVGTVFLATALILRTAAGLLFAAVALPFAFVGGGLIGAVAALMDLALLAAVERLA